MLQRTCAAFPSQWEGLLEDGRAIYIRARYGWLSFGLGSDIDEAIEDYDRHGRTLMALDKLGLPNAISTALMMRVLELGCALGFEYEDKYGEPIDKEPLIPVSMG